ncbi:MAG: acetyl-CoA carboxylase biotin carboxyl carrier protein [Steroidobacteraceae bacterium]
MLDHEDIERILTLLDATPLQEFELETDRFKITLRRTSAGQWTQQQDILRAGTAAAVTPGSDPSAAHAASDAGKEPVAAAGAGREIHAPLVGTFYRSPRPGAPPFVEMGSEVRPDTAVAIVETMKLMTSIYAGHAGRIGEILIEDGQFVEQDQVLMRVVADAQ